MKKYDLGGKPSESIELTNSEEPQSLVFKDVSDNAVISVELSRDTRKGERTIVPLNLPFVVEAQNKIEALLASSQSAVVNGKLFVTPVFDIKKLYYTKADHNTADPDPANHTFKKALKTSIVDLAFNGEIPLGDNDRMDVDLKTLDSITSTTMTVLGGRRTSKDIYTINQAIFKDELTEVEVKNKEFDFIVFDKDAMPEEIEFMYGSQKRVLTAELILQLQEDRFGVVGIDENNAPILGTNKAVVLRVSDATSVYLKHDNLAENLKYYTVKR